MDMKKLQNNFTTVEQSKRLLELGVPADSADCYYLREHDDKVYIFQNQKETDNCISKIRLRIGLGHAMPCWSVGRLIEIMCINDVYFDYGGCSYRRGYNMIDYIISQLESEDDLEFSELEE